ncbi:MAG: DoxX family membrane protein [Rhodospirillales bacterium]|nr:DoxX family membrane protein [Rhodospirillales bacterium]
MLLSISPRDTRVQARLALALRVGLGLVFIIGGVAKLARLLSVSKAQGIVDEYVGPLGYINQTFLDWLFSGQLPGFVTPWSFLTVLSAFELVSGVMLVAGLFVRPLAVVWALLLWSFVVSLPVVTAPGVTPPSPTYTSPAMFVQIRDIALSGFFFVLYNLGAGARSLDALRFGRPASLGRDWEPLGLVLRLSLGAVFLIGGFFAGFSKIATFGMPGVLLAVIGLGLVAGVGTRYFALAAVGVLVWFITAKLAGAGSAIGYLNSVKREFALLAAAGVLAAVDGGRLFALDRAWPALREGLATYLGGARRPPAGVVEADKARS